MEETRVSLFRRKKGAERQSESEDEKDPIGKGYTVSPETHIFWTVAPGLIAEKDSNRILWDVNSNHVPVNITLTRGSSTIQMVDTELQIAFFIAQRRGWKPPEFEYGKEVASATARELRLHLQEHQESLSEEVGDPFISLIAFLDGGAFTPIKGEINTPTGGTE